MGVSPNPRFHFPPVGPARFMLAGPFFLAKTSLIALFVFQFSEFDYL